VRWEELKPPATAGQPPATHGWMTPEMQEQLDASEARLAEELRESDTDEE